MKNNHVFLTLALLTCFAAPQKVLADEMWKTKEYNVIYQTDRNKTAIWSYGLNRLIFIDGLAGVTTNRGSYSGYWAQDRDRSSVRCDTYREGANGKPTYYWGRFEITFIDPDFPSRWQANLSLCDRLPTMTLNGKPITSDQ